MACYDKVNGIIDELLCTGSKLPYVDELRKQSIDAVLKDKSLSDVLSDITDEIASVTSDFLAEKNQFGTNLISGISTGIYLPYGGKTKCVLVGGTNSRDRDDKVDFDTIFDVASITKLFTLLLAFKLEENGFINLDTRVCDINPDFDKLDFTLNDLIRLYGEIRTEGRIDNASSFEEAYEIFKTLNVKSDDKSKCKYNDLGAMVLADTITKVVGKKLGEDLSYEEIMNRFFLKPLGLSHTMFNPKTSNISGSGYSNLYPHDPKARLFNGVGGHAGLFTNSGDLMVLTDALLRTDFLRKNHIDRLSQENIKGKILGNNGLYLWDPRGSEVTFTPVEYSKGHSFTSQGYTGSIASFDLRKGIHNSILVNAIDRDLEERLFKEKPRGFAEYFDKYEMQVVKRTMLMYVVKKYYNKYCRSQEDIEIKRTLSI